MSSKIKSVKVAIEYIENHLTDDLTLENVATAVHYSKYHLHRIFTEITGMTIHDYVQRRKLTEAARLLVFSDRSILEIALTAGYESQQSFTDIFKAMYKKSPRQYRESGNFYPLQLEYILNENLSGYLNEKDQSYVISYASTDDIPEWMNLVHLVVDGFPYLDDEVYLEQLNSYIIEKRAFIIKDADLAIGIMLFNEKTGSIDFLGVHPQYPKQEMAKAFLQRFREIADTCDITITTFREGDKADTGYRRMLEDLGFEEREFLTEFGYPTQQMILKQHLAEAKDYEW